MYALAAGLGEAKNRQNVEDALRFMHDDIVLFSPAWGVVARGKAENCEVLTHFFHNYPDYHVTFEGYVGDGDTFVGWGTVHMTMAAHASDANGLTPNGKRVEIPVSIRMTFREGLIATEHFLCDLAQIAVQSGVSVDAVSRNVFGAPAVNAASPPELEFLFEARVKLHLPPVDLGEHPEGRRLIFFVKGGIFEGPTLRGRVVPDGGADWVRARPDGSFHLDVRFCLQTDDDAMLYLYWHGRFRAEPQDLEYALNLEKPDDPSGAGRYYFRAAPQFETGDSRYAWLNNVVAVTRSRTGDGGVIHRVYAVK